MQGPTNLNVECEMLKGMLIIVWVAIVANLFIVLPDALVWPLKALGVLLVVAHIAELFIFRKDIEAKGDGTLKSFVMTFLFGAAYIKNL